MISKQLVLGSTLFLGGSVALFALTQKNNDTTQAITSHEKPVVAKQEDVVRPTVQPLTTDIETERRLLEQKRQEREARTLEQERQTQALLAEQERAKVNALQKAQAEQDAKKQPQTTTDDSSPAKLTVQTRPEIIKAQEEAKKAEAQKEADRKAEQAKKAEQANNQVKEMAKKDVKTDKKEPVKAETKAPKGQHTVQQGDTLIKLSHQYGIPVSVIASANNIGRNDTLTVGKNVKIPSKSEAQKIAKANEAKKSGSKEKTDTKVQAKEKSDTKKPNKVPTHYSVQVGLVPKDKAAELAKQYRQAGYKVQTSQTSRGVRVLVGSAKTEAEAHTLKNKIIKDGRVKTEGAWVKQVDEINAP